MHIPNWNFTAVAVSRDRSVKRQRHQHAKCDDYFESFVAQADGRDIFLTELIAPLKTSSWGLSENGGWRLKWTSPVRPKWACRADLAKRIILAFFVRASVDFLDHRDASDAFLADNLNPGVLQLDVVTQIRVRRLSEPFV